MTTANWTWAGLESVNVRALAACFVVVAVFLVLGFLWTRKPETRKRGIVTLSIILIPTILSAVVLLLRVLAS